METIKDSEGNSHVIFDESSLYDDSQMGDNISDFEILQILSERKNGQNSPMNSFIAKVRSSKNHKIYAMKKIEFNQNNFDFQYIQNYFNAMQKLTNLNNPHIIKYYKVFSDNNYNIFLIMEFMNNSDINGFIKAHQVLNKNIKEEEIWNILLQCLSALDYLHRQNLGNLGIQFCNIYMNNEQNAKISVFNEYKFSIQNNDIKKDIYNLGLYFYNMCFSYDPQAQIIHNSQVYIIEKNNPYYSNQLMYNIIYWMVKQDPNQRPYTNQLYNIVKEEYVKKYANNTSINAILRCLYSYQSLNKIMLKNENKITSNVDKYYINNW